MNDFEPSLHECPWCGKAVTDPVFHPVTGVPLEFVCEDCGAPIYFCSLVCWRQAHIALLKEEGLTGKEARRELLVRWGYVVKPSASA